MLVKKSGILGGIYRDIQRGSYLKGRELGSAARRRLLKQYPAQLEMLSKEKVNLRKSLDSFNKNRKAELNHRIKILEDSIAHKKSMRKTLESTHQSINPYIPASIAAAAGGYAVGKKGNNAPKSKSMKKISSFRGATGNALGSLGLGIRSLPNRAMRFIFGDPKSFEAIAASKWTKPEHREIISKVMANHKNALKNIERSSAREMRQLEDKVKYTSSANKALETMVEKLRNPYKPTKNDLAMLATAGAGGYALSKTATSANHYKSQSPNGFSVPEFTPTFTPQPQPQPQQQASANISQPQNLVKASPQKETSASSSKSVSVAKKPAVIIKKQPKATPAKFNNSSPYWDALSSVGSAVYSAAPYVAAPIAGLAMAYGAKKGGGKILNWARRVASPDRTGILLKQTAGKSARAEAAAVAAAEKSYAQAVAHNPSIANKISKESWVRDALGKGGQASHAEALGMSMKNIQSDFARAQQNGFKGSYNEYLKAYGGDYAKNMLGTQEGLSNTAKGALGAAGLAGTYGYAKSQSEQRRIPYGPGYGRW